MRGQSDRLTIIEKTMIMTRQFFLDTSTSISVE